MHNPFSAKVLITNMHAATSNTNIYRKSFLFTGTVHNGRTGDKKRKEQAPTAYISDALGS